MTFTKKIIKNILIVSLIDLQFPFILAFLGKEQIAETLGGLIVTEIIGVFFVYCTKSFFETKEEEKMKFAKDYMNIKEGDYDEHQGKIDQ